MKKKNYFLSVIFSLFALSGILTSCENINWFTNFMDDLNALEVPFTFYSAAGGNGTSFEKSYIIGKTISGEQLVNDSKDFILEKGVDGSTPYPSHAVVHGLKKNTASSGDDGVSADGNGIVTSVNVKQAVSFVPVIYYTAEFIHWMEGLSGNYEVRSTSSAYGPDGSSVDINGQANKYNKPGFTYDYSNPTSETFSSSGKQSINLYYTRDSVTITFDYNDGILSGAYSSSVTKKFETPTSSFIPGNPTKTNYVFNGWNPQVPDTFPATSTTYTAQWVPEEYTIEYFDCDLTVSSTATGAAGKSASYDTTGLVTTYSYGSNTYISPLPNNTLLSNSVIFDGWYTHPSGDISFKLPFNSTKNKYELTDGITKLYAKWLPKYVYVDPDNGNDSNSGFTPTTAVKTVNEARALITEQTSEIRVCNVITDTSDINNLINSNGLGDGHLIITRAPGYTGSIIKLTGDRELENITIDGGAVWSGSNVETASRSGVTSTQPLIDCNGKTVTLEDGCVIRNFYSANKKCISGDVNVSGGTIKDCLNGTGYVISGNITIEAGSLIDNCGNAIMIYGGQSFVMDGGIVQNCGIAITCSSTGTINITDGTIQNNSMGIQHVGDGSVTVSDGIIKDNGTGISAKIINLSDRAVIDQSNSIKLVEGGKITITGMLLNNIVATIEAPRYPYAEQVLYAGSGIALPDCTTKFNVSEPGYTFNTGGYIVSASTGGITPSTPSAPQEIALGSLRTHHVVKNVSGDTIVIFNVSDEAYNKMGDWKCIQYTIDADYGQANIQGNTGSYYAEINLTTLTASGSSSTHTLSIGSNTIMIFADSDDPDVVFIPQSEEIIISE